MLGMALAAPDRFAVYGIENHDGVPVYVHAKTCVVDDTWTTIGSDNFNRRSWTHDSELSAVVFDPDPDVTSEEAELLALAERASDRGGDAPRRRKSRRPAGAGGTPHDPPPPPRLPTVDRAPEGLTLGALNHGEAEEDRAREEYVIGADELFGGRTSAYSGFFCG